MSRRTRNGAGDRPPFVLISFLCFISGRAARARRRAPTSAGAALGPRRSPETGERPARRRDPDRDETPDATLPHDRACILYTARLALTQPRAAVRPAPGRGAGAPRARRVRATAQRFGTPLLLGCSASPRSPRPALCSPAREPWDRRSPLSSRRLSLVPRAPLFSFLCALAAALARSRLCVTPGRGRRKRAARRCRARTAAA